MTRNPDQRRHGDLAVREWQRRTNRALISCLASTIIYLVEKLIIQIVIVDYRRRQFDHRIKTYKADTVILSQLYEASCEKFPQREKFKELDDIISSSAGSGTPMDEIFGDINSLGDKVAGAFREVLREMIGNTNAWNQGESYQFVSKALEEKESAEALAEGIWKSCIPQESAGLTEESVGFTKEDLLGVMGQKREKEAPECFSSLDRDSNGDVSLKEIKLHVANLRKEKRGVERSWHNMVSKIYIT